MRTNRPEDTKIAHNILFVEYHKAFRQSASYLMDQEPDLEVVSQAGSVADGRRRMTEGGIDAAIVAAICTRPTPRSPCW